MKIASPTRTYTAQGVYPSRLGPMLLARTAKGLAGAWFEGQKHQPSAVDAPTRPDDALLRRTHEQLSAYFDGESAAFDVPLDLIGTEFQRAVWQALLAVGRGRTCSYGEIAKALGRPVAGRAVGAAVGRNPISVIVPCHRVIGSSGALTGYAGGIDRKIALLALEGAHQSTAGPVPTLG